MLLRGIIPSVHASEIIEMNEHPTKALKEKKEFLHYYWFSFYFYTSKTDASSAQAIRIAMMVGALFSIKAIEGVIRPTIGAYMPREDGSLGLLVDVGLMPIANQKTLNQFAVLGSLFAKAYFKFRKP